MSRLINSLSDCSETLLDRLNSSLKQFTNILDHSCCDKRQGPDISTGSWQAQAGEVQLTIINNGSRTQFTFKSPVAILTLEVDSPLDPLDAKSITTISGTTADLMDLVTPISFALIGHEIDNKVFFHPLTP